MVTVQFSLGFGFEPTVQEPGLPITEPEPFLKKFRFRFKVQQFRIWFRIRFWFLKIQTLFYYIYIYWNFTIFFIVFELEPDYELIRIIFVNGSRADFEPEPYVQIRFFWPIFRIGPTVRPETWPPLSSIHPTKRFY